MTNCCPWRSGNTDHKEKWRKQHETPLNPAAGLGVQLSLLLCLTLLPAGALAADAVAEVNGT